MEISKGSVSNMDWVSDSDMDGLPDINENCEGASQYDPNCIKTNPNEKDSDGDGWWDSIEITAETDPNNSEDRLY